MRKSEVYFLRCRCNAEIEIPTTERRCPACAEILTIEWAGGKSDYEQLRKARQKPQKLIAA